MQEQAKWHALKRRVEQAPAVTAFCDGPRELALVACWGIVREVGTLNDELTRFLFDAVTGERIPLDAVRAEVINVNDHPGVRIWVPGHEKLEVRLRGFRDFLHPSLSFDAFGAIRQLVLFPESIARILAEEGVELVFVRHWALNTVFGGFHPSESFYQTNFWELTNNDSLRFARLIENRRLTLLGTHDLTAHLAGARRPNWAPLVQDAGALREVLENYFEGVAAPSVASRILPYAAGVVLDDLAQPLHYNKPERKAAFAALLRGLRTTQIDPARPALLLRFPKNFQKFIELSRAERTSGEEAASGVTAIEKEILAAMVC